METAIVENSHSSTSPSSNADHHPENSVPDHLNDGYMEPKHEVSEVEARGIMEVIAATGKFWHDWDMLKSLLSSRLKQVLTEYPESQMVSDMIGPHQSYLSGETYPELVKKLDEALNSFVEGPPFTLQRLCEILLNPQSIYPNLSKLALAIEKNLLVTSTLTICTDPYPLNTLQKAMEPEKDSEEPQVLSKPTQNGIEVVNNGDEEMVDAEIDEHDKNHEDSNKNVEMETVEETISETSKTDSEPAAFSEPSTLSPSSENSNPTAT